MKVIGLGLNTSNKRGYTEIAYVDDKDFDLVSSFRWSNNGNGYIVTRGKTRNPILLHRLILGVIDSKIKVDHVDRNPLNNTRANLRIATNSQNKRNQGPQSNSKSRIRGVSWDKSGKRWKACLKYSNRIYTLLYAKDKELAAKTYAFFDKLICGEFHSNSPYYDAEFYPTKLTPKGRELLGKFTNG